MTTTEAINLLDQATGMVAATRQDHINIQQALTVLRDFEKKHTKPADVPVILPELGKPPTD